MMGRRLLWILPYWPWPTTSGGKLRQYHLLRELAQRGYRISLLVQTKTMPSEADLQPLRSWLEQLWIFPRRGLRSWRTLSAAALAPSPLLASVNGFNPVLSQTLAELLTQTWDIVQVEHSYSLQPYLASLRRYTPGFILTEHNVESSLSTSTYRRIPAALQCFTRWDQLRYQRWERLSLQAARVVVALTEADAKVFRALTPQPVVVVPNGAEIRVGAQIQADLAAQRVLFLGNYEYGPNLEAVHWLLEAIMPRIWLRCPNARLSLGGYAMPADWAQRWSDPRIEWLGYVADLPALQARSSVFIAPLRDGGGSKLKVLEAMSAGLPLVSTAQGVSGLAVQDTQHYLAADDSQGLADATVQLLADPARATRIAEAGRHYVRQEHSWQHVSDILEQLYDEVAG